MNNTTDSPQLQPFRASYMRYVIAFLIVALFVGYDSLFIVSEGEAMIVTRLGHPQREITQAGLYVKFPSPIEQLHRIDLRRNLLTTPQTASFTRDKRNIVLTTYVVWRVARPLVFLQSTGSASVAENSLAGMVMSAKNQTVGQHELNAFVSLEPNRIQVKRIEQTMTEQVSQAALERLGIAVEQIGIERIAFPDENMAAVLDRMRVERQAEANRLRAEGAKKAQAIRDEAHVKTQTILRAGREEAGKVLAQAETQAADLLAKSHEKNPAFHQFWSALQASKRVLKDKSTLILSTDQLFFKELIRPNASSNPVLTEHKDSPRPEKSILPMAVSVENRQP